MLKIRRPLGRLIFNMGIAIPGKTVFLIETAPWLQIWASLCGDSCGWLNLFLRISFNFCNLFWGSNIFARSVNMSDLESWKCMIQTKPPRSALPQRIYNFLLQQATLQNDANTNLTLNYLNDFSRYLFHTHLQQRDIAMLIKPHTFYIE